jgi:Rieske Fe-S protein
MHKLPMCPTDAQDNSHCMTRRQVLGALAGLTAAACSSSTVDHGAADGGAAEGGATTCGATPAGTNQGTVASYPLGTWKKKGAYIIAQDAMGFFAFSAICTHTGCPVNPPAADGQTLCACHGSKFDGNGAVLVGPAKNPLPHYAVAVCGGAVYVDENIVVDAATRTPAA